MNVWLQVLMAVIAGCIPGAFVIGLCYAAKWLTAHGL